MQRWRIRNTAKKRRPSSGQSGTRLREALLSLGFTVPESGANFLFAGRAKKSGGELYRALKEEGVLVRYWEKPVLRDFLRITVGTPQENDVLLEKLKQILK